MSVTIELPGPLRAWTDGAARVEVAGETVRDALDDLIRRFPRLRRHLFDDAGATRGFVNIFLNDTEVRSLVAGESTPVRAGDVLVVLPSVAGGRGRVARARGVPVSSAPSGARFSVESCTQKTERSRDGRNRKPAPRDDGGAVETAPGHG